MLGEAATQGAVTARAVLSSAGAAGALFRTLLAARPELAVPANVPIAADAPAASGELCDALPEKTCMDRRNHFMMAYLWVALGGALGGMARYGVGLAAARLWGSAFPWGTILINVAGSFIISFFGTLTLPGGPLPADMGVARLRHGGHLRRIHHVLLVQPADAGTGARRGLGSGVPQRRAVRGAVPAAVAAGICWPRASAF